MKSEKKQSIFEKLLLSMRKYKIFRPFTDLYFKHREIIMYLIFGVLTTLVDYAVYFPLSNLLNLHYLIANLFAWIAAVIFAFITNKLWVFDSRSFKFGIIIREFTSFVCARLLSFAVQEALLFLSVDIADINGNISKIAVSVVVVILNYIFSKMFVFANKTQTKEKSK